ncbi:MAG: DNA mismatch repair endonuclease MutL [Marinilabiliales bacterium]
MPDLIKLLPDSVANQIAAGEVIQRPASIIKELVENSIDAGATKISIIVKDSGKTSIQVIDNGMGMSETDGRLSFERHATSKIRKADDLFEIKTMGFRGEALASIAAISHVELKTKKPEAEVGTYIQIEGSKVIKQEPVSCPSGSNFLIKNLFYNVPARRKFLKSDATEWRHILDEFYRVAIPNPDIEFVLKHNNEEIYNLPPGNYKQRIVALFGKNINQNLIQIKSETSIVTINGYVGKPEYARKKSGQQFFFVNKRYMRHPYFYKAILNAYENLLPHDVFPSFFIYFSVDPKNIDINIHPTKTEIKFEDEMSIWQILQATVKESLGKYNIVPSLDFDQEQSFQIPVLPKNKNIQPPEIKVNTDYNPFKGNTQYPSKNIKNQQLGHWEKLYSGSVDITNSEAQKKEEEIVNIAQRILQIKNKYIVTPVKSGLMLIDQKRAYERIIYDNLNYFSKNQSLSQRLLYPVSIELNHYDFDIINNIKDQLKDIGFEIDVFGKNTIIVNSLPYLLDNADISQVFDELIEQIKIHGKASNENIEEQIKSSVAKSGAVSYNKTLSEEEMKNLIDTLFSTSSPNFTPDGKKIIEIINISEIETKFKK